MYPSIGDDDDLLAALCFDQSNGAEDPYAFIQTDQENLFPDFGSSGVNLQGEQEQGCNIGAQFDSFSGNFPQACSFREENNDLRGGYGGVVYSNSSIGSAAQLDLSASFSELLQQEPHQVCSFRTQNDGSSTHLQNQQQQEPEQVCNGVVEINSSSSVGGVKEEQEHVEEECSRKRRRTGSCSKPGTKACREKQRREQLNERFMDLSSVLEPTRTPKTDKSAILDDAIRVVNQLRGEATELKDTNQKLQEEIKSLKAEKNELREEKLVLKADKEKVEQQLKSMAAVPSPGFMPSPHPAAFHPSKLAVYPSYGYYPNMAMWPPYLHPSERDTSHDHLKRPPAA
ncbi:unnamed protein product [Microthlaspi erraticum]|uniref:BHLH domain-containing protein n=1 Tax=Microthlaspi erraticum TaxID=1685480 RepID=A0A6D2HE15_9BRAS|nr:unnamed protein product [Microthlaspi erraticum]